MLCLWCGVRIAGKVSMDYAVINLSMLKAKISAEMEKGKTMTALEYMEKQIQQHRISHIQAVDRNAPEEMLENIRRKISYYEEAIEALKERNNNESS